MGILFPHFIGYEDYILKEDIILKQSCFFMQIEETYDVDEDSKLICGKFSDNVSDATFEGIITTGFIEFKRTYNNNKLRRNNGNVYKGIITCNNNKLNILGEWYTSFEGVPENNMKKSNFIMYSVLKHSSLDYLFKIEQSELIIA